MDIYIASPWESFLDCRLPDGLYFGFNFPFISLLILATHVACPGRNRDRVQALAGRKVRRGCLGGAEKEAWRRDHRPGSALQVPPRLEQAVIIHPHESAVEPRKLNELGQDRRRNHVACPCQVVKELFTHRSLDPENFALKPRRSVLDRGKWLGWTDQILAGTHVMTSPWEGGWARARMDARTWRPEAAGRCVLSRGPRRIRRRAGFVGVVALCVLDETGRARRNRAREGGLNPLGENRARDGGAEEQGAVQEGGMRHPSMSHEEQFYAPEVGSLSCLFFDFCCPSLRLPWICFTTLLECFRDGFYSILLEATFRVFFFNFLSDDANWMPFLYTMLGNSGAWWSVQSWIDLNASTEAIHWVLFPCCR